MNIRIGSDPVIFTKKKDMTVCNNMSFFVFFVLEQVDVALKNKMDLSLGVALGSSSQIALLVVPFSVSWWEGRWKWGKDGGQNGAHLFLNGKGDRGSDTGIFLTKKKKKMSLVETKEVEVEDGFFFDICCFLVANTLVELCRIRHF